MIDNRWIVAIKKEIISAVRLKAAIQNRCQLQILDPIPGVIFYSKSIHWTNCCGVFALFPRIDNTSCRSNPLKLSSKSCCPWKLEKSIPLKSQTAIRVSTPEATPIGETARCVQTYPETEANKCQQHKNNLFRQVCTKATMYLHAKYCLRWQNCIIWFVNLENAPYTKLLIKAHKEGCTWQHRCRLLTVARDGKIYQISMHPKCKF